MPTLAEQWAQQGREEGRQEGLEEGREEGELIGQIRAFQEVLGLPVATKQSLLELNVEQLRAQLAELRTRLRQS